VPQETIAEPTMRSPGAIVRTASPTASTTPTYSWPETKPISAGITP
jgi:hypothetical protein